MLAEYAEYAEHAEYAKLVKAVNAWVRSAFGNVYICNISRAVEAFRDVGPKLVRQLVAIYR